MGFSQRGQQCCRPQHVPHGIKLDNEKALFDFLVLVASAKYASSFVPHAGTVT
jgi:hypothetical protein